MRLLEQLRALPRAPILFTTSTPRNSFSTARRRRVVRLRLKRRVGIAEKRMELVAERWMVLRLAAAAVELDAASLSPRRWRLRCTAPVTEASSAPRAPCEPNGHSSDLGARAPASTSLVHRRAGGKRRIRFAARCSLRLHASPAPPSSRTA